MACLRLRSTHLLSSAIYSDLHLSIVISLLMLIRIIHLSKLFLVCQRVWTELLGLFSWSLLVSSCLIRQTVINIHPLGTLLCGHVEYWRSLARIIDDDVVDVIVIDDVGDVTSRALGLDAFMLMLSMSWRWTSTAHAESLAVRNSLTFKPALIFTLLCHWVLSKLLRASNWSLLVVIPITVDKVIVLLVILLILIGLLSVIWT